MGRGSQQTTMFFGFVRPSRKEEARSSGKVGTIKQRPFQIGLKEPLCLSSHGNQDVWRRCRRAFVCCPRTEERLVGCAGQVSCSDQTAIGRPSLLSFQVILIIVVSSLL
jgi:hypothetical protein